LTTGLSPSLDDWLSLVDRCLTTGFRLGSFKLALLLPKPMLLLLLVLATVLLLLLMVTVVKSKDR
jgi:hypothetical protein